MGKKSVVFGMGLGILMTATLFFFVYNYQKQRDATDNAAAATLSDEAVIERARRLGMAFYLTPEDVPQQTDAPPSTTSEPSQTQVPPQQTATPPPAVLAGQSPAPNPAPESITVEIPVDSSAQAIAEILYERGVIGDTDAFVRFLAENNGTKTLGFGRYEIPPGADYAAVFQIIRENSL